MSARPQHLGHLIADAVQLFADRPALIGGDTEITYAQLDERSDRVASSLSARDIGPGDRVALLWSNHVDYVQTLIGVLRAGAVAVPLNPKLGDDALRHVLDDAGAVALLPGPDAEDRAAPLVDDVATLRLSVTASELVAHAGTPPQVDVAPDDICLQPYTSGSTGKPKGVLLTHAGQIWNIDIARRVLLVDESDRALVAIPMFHANAAITVQMMLSAGASLVIHEAFDPVAVLHSIERHRCTFLGGVPAMFHMLIEARRANPEIDVSTLSVAAVGSADVPSALYDAFLETFGIPLAEGYGLTEGGPYVALTPRWGVRRPGSAGLALPGGDLEVRDPADPERRLPAGEVGELWVRNPGVAVAYNNLPELSADRLRDGWLATGDLARVDEDGYLSLAGRSDDLINVGGENVYPREVEEILLAHPDVRAAGVVSLPDARKGEVPVAAIACAAGAELDAQQLTEFFCERGPAYAHPRRIVFVDALPLLGTGKLDRAAVRELVKGAT